MRSQPTPAEAHLWKILRMRQVGRLKFRRQHIIQTFIVDFYCPEAKLVIEVDGPVHRKQVEYDQERDMCLHELGFQVLRFKNGVVTDETEKVIAKIIDACMETNSSTEVDAMNKLK